MSLSPRPDAILAFLRRVRTSGFHVLVCIEPDSGGIETRAFAERETDQATSWAAEWNSRGRNVYWTVNGVSRPLASKPSRADIETMDWLHVDVDAERGRPLEDELLRIATLTSEGGLPRGVPPPTLVVASGGGRQAFWRLEQPVEIGGRPEAYEDAKRWNQQLEVLFGGDHCHNVDRIMRLPGTVNWPNAKKAAAGRTPVLAEVVEWRDVAYPLSAFTPAPAVQQPGEVIAAPVARVETGNVRRLASLDELPETVSGRVKVVIAQGKDPDNPGRWPSRSEPLFWVCCELVRAGVSDEVIYSVITDPDFLISESVLEKRARAERYALQQIAHAHEAAQSPELAELNRRHAVIGDIGGKCRILNEVADDGSGRAAISYQSFDDFCNRYANRQVVAGEKVIPLGRFWITHPLRRTYDRVVFAPGQEPAGAYNLWRGFACEAIPGDCSLYLEHLRRNICRGDDALAEYVLSWMASAVQDPGRPAQTAIVLRGLQGAGKGKLVSWFGRLFGRHFMHVTNPTQLVGQFNVHLKDCVVLFADEAFFAGDKRHEGILKALVTESHIAIEGKYLATEMSRNCLHIMMASNNDWVVPAGRHERRFLLLDVGEGNLQDRTFFAALDQQMRAGGREALLHLLLSRDLSGFDAGKVPRTRALQEQKEHSLSLEEEWWYGKLRSGEIREGAGWPEWIACSELMWDFTQHAQRWGRGQRTSTVRLGRLLDKAGVKRRQLGRKATVLCGDGTPRQVDRPRIFSLPPIEDARSSWARMMGGDFDWERPALLEAGATEAPYE